MRPAPGSDSMAAAASTPRSRKSSVGEASYSQGPTSFFLATQGQVERMRDEADKTASGQHEVTDASSSTGAAADNVKDSVFSVQSLEDALGEAFGQGKTSSTSSMLLRKDSKKNKKKMPEGDKNDDVSGMVPSSSSMPGTPAALDHLRQPSTTVSQPLTPLQPASPAPGWGSAMLSTPKSASLRSLRLSDEEESQAGVDESSSDDIGEKDKDGFIDPALPELVMPRLAMPSRRPFTEKGKKMGRLRVCVAGKEGVGKTSLIRAIVQQCEDIVHVDPLTPFPSTSQTAFAGKSRPRPKKSVPAGTSSITEINASTKACPEWWSSEVEESKLLRRRKSLGDVILERNLCFVDTPGFGKSATSTAEIDSLVRYLEDSFWRIDSQAELSDSEKIHLLSGNGGNLVDVVLYIFAGEDYISEDVENFRQLSLLTNVIPIIGKSDTIASPCLLSLKLSILGQLQTSSAEPFLWGKSVQDIISCLISNQGHDEAEATSMDVPSPLRTQDDPAPTLEPAKPENPTVVPPFAISSLQGADELEMDASLLMSSSYIPPLLPSELPSLVDRLFDPEVIPWFRHTAARKFLSWRDRQLAAAMSELGDSLDMGSIVDPVRRHRLRRLVSESNRRASAPGQIVLRRSASLGTSTSSPAPGFTFASSNWPREASPDGNILDSLPRADRARWLLERINEEVSKGSIGLLREQRRRAYIPPYDNTATAGLLPTSSELPTISNESTSRVLSERSGLRSSRRRNPGNSDLPAWARRGQEMTQQRPRSRGVDPRDPLGLCGVFEGLGRALALGVGGGMVVGAVWAVVVRGWVMHEPGWRWFGDA